MAAAQGAREAGREDETAGGNDSDLIKDVVWLPLDHLAAGDDGAKRAAFLTG